MKNFILLSVLCTVCIVSCSRREKTWQLVWEDDFNRNDIFSTGVWTKMPRWHNADCCNTMSDDESLYEIKNGNLILLGKPNPNPAKDTAKYITGGVWTKDKKYFNSGRIEIRCKLEATQGSWPAIWLLTQKSNWPIEGGEIDILERLNFDPFVYQTVHSPYTYLGKPGPKNSAIFKIQPNDYNIYAAEWDEAAVHLYVNGESSLTYPRIPGKEGEGQFPFDNTYFLIIDMQLGGKWVGKVEKFDKPIRMYIDWVRFYQKK